jgi:biopolymer transport protein ExbB
MWPLLFFSIAVIALSLERALYLGYHNLRVDDMAARVSRYVAEKNLEDARTYLAGLTKRRMGARVLLALVNHAGPERRMERAAEAEALGSISSLENGFSFLTALGSLAPLTGFLGTVSGMIGAFRSIAEAVEVNARIVAGGISEALITTAFGLIIAIIAMIAHALLSRRVDQFAADLEKCCSGLITEIAEAHEN